MKNVKLSGGFHNAPTITLRVSDSAYNAIKDVENGNITISEWVQRYLSENQEKRLDNHFCGIDGCTCGSYCRAEFE